MKGIYLDKYIFSSNKMKPHHPHLLFLVVISLLLTDILGYGKFSQKGIHIG